MKRNRIAATIALVLSVTALIVLTGSCKKQPKCGCDGDALDSLSLTHVYRIHIQYIISVIRRNG